MKQIFKIEHEIEQSFLGYNRVQTLAVAVAIILFFLLFVLHRNLI